MMHDGPSATPERGAATKPPVGVELGLDRPRGERLRLWHLLALAILTLVCAGITRDAPRIAHLAAPLDLAATGGVTVRSELAAQPSLRARHPARVVVDLKAVEPETDDDDGDPLPDMADAPAVSVRGSFPRKPCRALRGAPQIDTSRFAIGTGLPRGPPA